MAPVIWGCLILVASQTFTIFTALREKNFVEMHQIVPPQVHLGIPLAYFFVTVLLLGVIFAVIPMSKLRIALKILFTLLFSWGLFIPLGLSLPIPLAAIISITGALLWFFQPVVWGHNLLLVFALVSVGSVFGLLLSPLTAVSFMLVISVYDLLAVRFGYMMWMARKLSQSDALPAFVIPRKTAGWSLNLKEAGFMKLFEDKSAEREFSILGGGDIGFPLLLVVSILFAHGFASAVIVAVFSLLGLISAYLIQMFFLKGKPMPALPPISFMSLIGFLIVYYI